MNRYITSYKLQGSILTEITNGVRDIHLVVRISQIRFQERVTSRQKRFNCNTFHETPPTVIMHVCVRYLTLSSNNLAINMAE